MTVVNRCYALPLLLIKHIVKSFCGRREFAKFTNLSYVHEFHSFLAIAANLTISLIIKNSSCIFISVINDVLVQTH